MTEHRRHRYAYVGERNLLDLMTGRIRISNLPKDAKIIRSSPADACYGGGVALVIKSSSFDEVIFGERLPTFILEFTRVG